MQEESTLTMKKPCLLIIAAAVSILSLVAYATEKNAARWRSLFDGKTLKGWAATGSTESWGVEDGAISLLTRGGGYLYTLDQFENFELSVDFKIDKGVNSGIFFRWSDLKDPVNTGIEMQVLDSYGNSPAGKHDCGAIYDIAAPSKQACKPAGEWNTVVITCDKSLVSVDLNGERVVRIDLNDWTTAGINPDGSRNKFSRAYKDLPRRGHIGLQDHGGRVWFKNVRIRER